LTFTNEENVDQTIRNPEIAQRCISLTFNWQAYTVLHAKAKFCL